MRAYVCTSFGQHTERSARRFCCYNIPLLAMSACRASSPCSMLMYVHVRLYCMHATYNVHTLGTLGAGCYMLFASDRRAVDGNDQPGRQDACEVCDYQLRHVYPAEASQGTSAPPPHTVHHPYECTAIEYTTRTSAPPPHIVHRRHSHTIQCNAMYYSSSTSTSVGTFLTCAIYIIN